MHVVDPRPALAGEPVALATRPGTLAGRRVLLFDNGKADPRLGHFQAVLDVIGNALRDRFPDVRISQRTDDLLRRPIEEIPEVADEIASAATDGVVLALCDYGVSQPTAVLAAELERRGVPTSTVCQGAGLAMMATIAASAVPGLPLAALRDAAVPAWWTASREQIEHETAHIAGDAIDGLILAPAALRRRAEGYPAAPALRPDPAGLDVEDDVAFTAAMRESGLGDGLPLVAPTEERVRRMLGGRDPDLVVWPVISPRTEPLRARAVAAIAVMAGCDPRWCAVVLAAYRAMADPAFRLAQAAFTTNPSGTLVVVSGPRSAAYGLAAGAGSLGPGHPANATIGRAVALAYAFGFGARIGYSDLSMQGSPAKYSYCCAEDLAESPWPGLHEDLAGPAATTVTVFKCEGPRSVADNTSTTPAALLATIAGAAVSIANVNVRNPYAQTVVFLNPAHARILAAGGMSKAEVRRWLFENARVESSLLRASGGRLERRPPWMDGLDRFPIVERPEDFLLVVTGSAGLHSAVAPPWGTARACTTQVAE